MTHIKVDFGMIRCLPLAVGGNHIVFVYYVVSGRMLSLCEFMGKGADLYQPTAA